ncbi:MAG: hypothetical protein N2319_05305 [Candidatus Kapabacteria bacterium]|nr:hypothetical protein [Candidatus Kapabacteria bacterium]
MMPNFESINTIDVRCSSVNFGYSTQLEPPLVLTKYVPASPTMIPFVSSKK